MFDRPNPYQHPYYTNAYYQQPAFYEPQYPPVPPTHPAYMQTPFEKYAKPKQPDNWYPPVQQHATTPFYPPTNPNLKNGLLAYFQDNEGQVDLNKMLSTAGQAANTFQQVTPVVKQVGSIIKSFR